MDQKDIDKLLEVDDNEPTDVWDEKFQRRRNYSGHAAIGPDNNIYYVVGFDPPDASEPAKTVKLKMKGSQKIKNVPYKTFVNDYKRSRGSLASTAISPSLQAWAVDEEQQGNLTDKPKDLGSIASKVATYGRGAVDKDSKTNRFVRLDTARTLEPSLSSAGVRLEDELARDKAELVAQAPNLFKQMSYGALIDYKNKLEKPFDTAVKATKSYAKELFQSGELNDEEKNWMLSVSTSDPATMLGAVWELTSFHEDILPNIMMPVEYISSISSIVGRTGRLNPKQLHLDDPVIDDALRDDPGFRKYLGAEKFWDRLRNAAEKMGMYRGQF